MSGHALFRGAGRRRGHGGERLPGPGDLPGPAGARPVGRDQPSPSVPQLQGRGRGGPLEDPLQDGDLGDLVLSRRLQLRGRRRVARPGPGVLPGHALAHLWHRPRGPGEEGPGDPQARLRLGGGHAAGGGLLQVPPHGRDPRLRGAADTHPAAGLRHRKLRPVQALFRGAAHHARRAAARPPGLARRGQGGPPGRGGERQRDPQALRHSRHVAGGAGA